MGENSFIGKTESKEESETIGKIVEKERRDWNEVLVLVVVVAEQMY